METGALSETNLLERGDAAQRRGDLPAAFRDWNAFRDLHPELPYAYVRIGSALRTAGRFDEADALYDEALTHCEDQLALSIDRAWVAHDRKDWPEALDRWHAVARRYPHHDAGFVGVGRVLIALKRLEEAEAVLGDATVRHPASPWILQALAQTASARGLWTEALRRWNVYLKLQPDDEWGLSQRGEALWHIQLEDEDRAADEGPIDRTPVAIERVKNSEACALLTTFESIGENCEFGLVQRRFEAEPLGLLRWTYTAPQKLAELLETQFEGIGEPENISLSRSDWNEYFFQDAKFGINFHTFITQTIDDEAAFLRKQVARLRWLRDRLLEDLRAAQKIFVFKAHHNQYEAQIPRIAAALRSYGPNTLLWVGLATSDRPAGSAVADGTGLVRGHLSRLNPVPDKGWDIPFDEWLSICRQTRAIVDGAGRG